MKLEKKIDPPVGTYVQKTTEKKSKKKRFGNVILIKTSSLVVSINGDGVLVTKTAKHKNVKIGDKIEI